MFWVGMTVKFVKLLMMMNDKILKILAYSIFFLYFTIKHITL